MKRVLAFIFALLFAGSALCLGGWGSKMKKGVVDGVAVGGMTFEEAESSVRRGLSRIPFTLRTPAGDLTPPIVYTDDLSALLRQAKRGEAYAVTVRREFPDAERYFADVCAENVRATLRSPFRAEDLSIPRKKRACTATMRRRFPPRLRR